MKKLKLYYIYHSCFVVETEKHLLVFDYYKTPLKADIDDISLIDIVSKSLKKVIVFSSHGHYDHFNKDILNWKNENHDLTYILSSDILLDGDIKNCYQMSEGENLNLGYMTIKAYGSSDLGVSFLVEVDEVKIFHAGDLNWWYWKDDTEAEEKYMRELYTGIVEKIRINKEIDVAFFPVDPRLEEFCYLGSEYFAENIKPKFMIPMHFDENFYVGEELKKRVQKYHVDVIEIFRTNSLLKI